MCFDIRERYLRTVDIRDTHFSIRKGCVWLVDILYKRSDIWKGFVTMT